MPNPPLRFSEWYEVNDYPLATHGYAIESVTAGMPAKRGQNIVAPMVHGQIFQQKRFDARGETWTMWVCDADPDTGVVPSTDAEKNAQFLENMRTVNSIFSNTRQLLEIKKVSNTGTTKSITNIVRTSNTVTVTTSTAHGLKVGDYISVNMDGTTYDSAEVYGAVVTAVTTTSPHTVSYVKSGTNITSTAATGTLGIFQTLQAEAEYLSAIPINDWKTLKYATFNIEMTFPDPRWYDIHDTVFQIGIVNATTDTFIVTSDTIGTAPVTNMTIEFIPSTTTSPKTLVGPMYIKNEVYYGATPTKVAQIGYSQTLVDPNDVTIDTEELTVRLNSTTNVVENLTRSGPSYEWFAMYPDGDTNLFTLVTSGTSNGQAKITFKKAYFI